MPTAFSRNYIGIAFVLAFLLHLSILMIPQPKTEKAETFSNIEVVPLDKLDRPVVQSADRNEESNQKADYYADRRNRVREETRAPLPGKFRSGESATATPNPDKVPQTELAEQGLGDLNPNRSGGLVGQDPHRHSKDLKVGRETAVNTDGILYASFINRIADAIYPAWVQNAREAVEDANRGRIQNKYYTTRIRVVLNRSGDVTEIELLTSSGILELDEAPKKAFWQREPFRNPPKQLFNEDGFAKLVYEFQFQVESSSFSIFPQRL